MLRPYPQAALLRMGPWAFRFLITVIACGCICNQSVNIMAITDCRILFHFHTLPIYQLSRSSLRIPSQLTSQQFTRLIRRGIQQNGSYTSNKTNEFVGIHRFWGLHSMKTCVAVRTECSVLSDTEHFHLTITELKVFSGKHTTDYHPERFASESQSPFWCGHTLRVNICRHKLKHEMYPIMWTGVIRSSRLIHANGNRWHCDHSASTKWRQSC